jgi:D-arabinose 1-dehydrogenase-like Zn-dependent alcohol dehydrogenase
MTKRSVFQIIFVGAMSLFLMTSAVFAQTTAFTYQGKLTDNGAAQSAYQMQFALFDALVGGSQIGGTLTNSSVAVTQEMAGELFAQVAAGMKIPVERRYALADAAQAHRDLESRNTTGAGVLIP